MAYSDFTLDNVGSRLSLVLKKATFLPPLEPLPPSKWLFHALEQGAELAIDAGSEKARSEFIIAPILLELRSLAHKQISIFSGQEFTVNRELGLSGACDFLIARSSFSLTIEAPIIALVEAKKGIVKDGLGQCIAEMSAAQMFNAAKEKPIDTIYGIVTTGTLWQFLQLQEQTVSIDSKEYSLDPVDRLLAILYWMLQIPPQSQ
jgi:hypothetical protein